MSLLAQLSRFKNKNEIEKLFVVSGHFTVAHFTNHALKTTQVPKLLLADALHFLSARHCDGTCVA